MKNRKSFTEKININTVLTEFNFEENGGSNNSWFKVFSKNGAFPSFNMEQNTRENPQEYIIIKRSILTNEILKIEKELSIIIQENR
jgi:hypothetical protein